MDDAHEPVRGSPDPNIENMRISEKLKMKENVKYMLRRTL